jgi:7-cyano-7-deazaguanine synthase in queuosine biosynthesis
MSNGAHISVRSTRGQPARGATHDCVIGADLAVDMNALPNYCASLLCDVEHDLAVLCGAVMLADRFVPRRRASGWPRDLEVSVPVHDPALWSERRIVAQLVDALEFVSGDNWSFNFVPGPGRVAADQSSLDWTDGPYVVLPFSEGLDSYLQWKLLAAEEKEVRTLRIQSCSRSSNEERLKAIDRTGEQRDQRLRLPVSIRVGNHPEPSYRTRTFRYFCMAALAAVKAKSRRVVIGENGVGAIGASMITYGNECPHRTSHPAYTRRVAAFVNQLLGSRVEFEHPQIERTKGEVLARALALGIGGWEQTNSCVRGRRDRLDDLPCGACSGCLLRRSALLAAGIEPVGYFWDRLGASSLDEGRLNAGGRQAQRNDCDIAYHGAHAIAAFAELAALGPDAEAFRRAAWEWRGPVQAELAEGARKIHRLAQAHAREWGALMAYFGEPGLLNFKQAS